MVEISKKRVKKGWKWVKLGENPKNATSPMWKKHQNLISNNNDAHNITKYGFLVRLDAEVVALRSRSPLKPRKHQDQR